MDSDLYVVRQWMNEQDKKQLVLAKCVYKLMGAAGVRCEDHGIDRSEWDSLQAQLAEAFNYEVYE